MCPFETGCNGQTIPPWSSQDAEKVAAASEEGFRRASISPPDLISFISAMKSLPYLNFDVSFTSK